MKKAFFLVMVIGISLITFGFAMPETELGIEAKLEPSTVAIIIGGVYEILSRLIPTVKDYTIVGRFIKWIHKVSDYLNVKSN